MKFKLMLIMIFGMCGRVDMMSAAPKSTLKSPTSTLKAKPSPSKSSPLQPPAHATAFDRKAWSLGMTQLYEGGSM